MQIQPIRCNICKYYSNRVCQVGERGGVILPHQGSRLTNDRLVFMLMLVDAPAHTKVGAKYKS